MRKLFSTLTILCTILILSACQTETMVLLDEEIAQIHIAESNGAGDMNAEEILLTIDDKELIATFKNAITTAVKQSSTPEQSTPDYDVMVEYVDGLPTHAIHLWLGEEGEESKMTYFTNDAVYYTSPKMTNELREMLLSQ
mgnify:CR=1 FL=1